MNLAAIAALGEPTRRRLYDYVARQSQPVSRDDAAAAVRLPRTTAAFHLDRLAAEGLLSVVHERRTGRSGPGSGRPSKLYQRSDQQIAVSLPQRQYELAGRLLAAAIDEAAQSGESPRTALEDGARKVGMGFAAAAHRDTRERDNARDSDQDTVVQILEDYGFEPRIVSTEVLLGNCPFHHLAQEHTDLICGMNLCLLEGLLDGLDATGLSASLEPTPDHCCVRLKKADRPDP